MNHSKVENNREGHGAVSEKKVFVRSELISSRDPENVGGLDLREGGGKQ